MLPVASTTDECIVGPSLEEVPETVVDEHEQEVPADVSEGEDDDELCDPEQQPEEAEKAGRSSTTAEELRMMMMRAPCRTD